MGYNIAKISWLYSQSF